MLLTVDRDVSLPREIARGLSNVHAAGQLITATTDRVWKLLTGKVDSSLGIVPLIDEFCSALEAGQPGQVVPTDGIRLLALLSSIWPAAGSATSPRGLA
jgi:hypothetical protein